MILALLASCAPSPSASAAGSSPTWSADIAPLFAASCSSCHTSGGIAPFALDDYELAAGQRAAIRASVADRSMPPWLADGDCHAYADDPSLTDAQIQTVLDWVDAGAPEGDPGVSAPASAAGGGLARVDLTLDLPEPYTAQTSPDDYRCFLLDWPEEVDTYVTGLQVHPDNEAIVHHVIAFLAPAAEAATFEALDEAEEGPGYTCFGGPGGSSTSTSWLGAWAPGGVGGDFPTGTGLPVAVGSKVILQVHYNTANVETLADAVDQSGIELSLAESVERPARMVPWTDPAWVAGSGMEIPAGSSDVSHSYSIAVPEGRDFAMHAAALHMHTLGVAASMTVTHGDGSTECLVDIPAWDFDWQRSYRFAGEVAVAAGDTLNLLCTWDNPTDQDIAWGEGTGDEMCLGVFYGTAP